MKYAPFLLQAFAARVLANQQEVTVSHKDLREQGYDVETLVEMVGAYSELKEEDRGFHVAADGTTISLRRKPNGSAPVVPPVNTPAATPAAKPSAPASKPAAAAKPAPVGGRSIAAMR